MNNYKNNIVGIGCDFQNESNENSRKLAIESLSGGERDRVSWMTDNMENNKAYRYKIINKSNQEKKIILKNMIEDYLSYRKGWKNQPINSFQQKCMEINLKKIIILHYVLI